MLRGVLAQRLVRKLCNGCAVTIVGALTPEEQRLADLTGVRPSRRPVGCDFCAGTGYYGRMAVPEVLLMTPTLEKLVTARATAATIHRTAEAEGLRTLQRVALDYVGQGITTFEEVQRAIGDLAPAAGATGGPPKVLVVDDDASMRLVEGALLKSLGVEVVEAATGTQAMERLEGPEDYSLVLLDLQMPEMDGDEVLRRMRGSSRHAQTPVIIFTGHPDPSLEVTMIEAGADDYLRKPLDPARFTARCKSALRRAA
jgi:CheY-like chemotaxis protein